MIIRVIEPIALASHMSLNIIRCALGMIPKSNTHTQTVFSFCSSFTFRIARAIAPDMRALSQFVEMMQMSWRIPHAVALCEVEIGASHCGVILVANITVANICESHRISHVTARVSLFYWLLLIREFSAFWLLFDTPFFLIFYLLPPIKNEFASVFSENIRID